MARRERRDRRDDAPDVHETRYIKRRAVVALHGFFFYSGTRLYCRVSVFVYYLRKLSKIFSTGFEFLVFLFALLQVLDRFVDSDRKIC